MATQTRKTLTSNSKAGKDLLAQINGEYEMSKSKGERKHQMFETIDNKIDNPEKVEKYLRSNLVKTNLEMLDATLYNETMEIVPQAKMSAYEDIAKKIKAAMENDYEEMELDKLKRRVVSHFNR